MRSKRQQINGNYSGLDLSGPQYGNMFGEQLFTGEQMQETNLSGHTIRNACFDNADFSGANLSEVTLINVSFKGANLTGVDLRDALLHNVCFDNALLVRVNLHGAQLEKVTTKNAMIHQTRGLTGKKSNSEPVRMKRPAKKPIAGITLNIALAIQLLTGLLALLGFPYTYRNRSGSFMYLSQMKKLANERSQSLFSVSEQAVFLILTFVGSIVSGSLLLACVATNITAIGVTTAWSTKPFLLCSYLVIALHAVAWLLVLPTPILINLGRELFRSVTSPTSKV